MHIDRKLLPPLNAVLLLLQFPTVAAAAGGFTSLHELHLHPDLHLEAGNPSSTPQGPNYCHSVCSRALRLAYGSTGRTGQSPDVKQSLCVSKLCDSHLKPGSVHFELYKWEKWKSAERWHIRKKQTNWSSTTGNHGGSSAATSSSDATSEHEEESLFEVVSGLFLKMYVITRPPSQSLLLSETLDSVLPSSGFIA